MQEFHVRITPSLSFNFAKYVSIIWMDNAVIIIIITIYNNYYYYYDFPLSTSYMRRRLVDYDGIGLLTESGYRTLL